MPFMAIKSQDKSLDRKGARFGLKGRGDTVHVMGIQKILLSPDWRMLQELK